MRWPWSRKSDATFVDDVPKPIDQLWLEMVGRASTGPVGRNDALSVPAVQRGRNLICSVAAMPLVQHGPDNTVVPSSLLAQLDPDVPNVVTLAMTLEDLLFDSVAWWLVTATDFAGFPISVRHLDVGQVSLQPPANPSPLPSGTDPRRAAVWVDGVAVAASRVIRFDSPNPAVRIVGGRAIRRAILLDAAASMYADDPRPLDYFSPTAGADPIDDADVLEILNAWKAARKCRGTAWVPSAMTYNSVATPSPQQLQLVELQREAVLEIAQAMGVDPEDLGLSTTSRTYSNDVDRRRNKLNETLAPFMRAVEHRLTMTDVTRRGYAVLFDTMEYLRPNPNDRWAGYEIARRLGAITVGEIREAEGMPPLTPEQEMTMPAVAADAEPALVFDAGDRLTFADLPLAEFSVDRESRVIEGLALPYGKVATKGGLKFRFDKGSLQYGDVSRVKLLRDHGQAIGKATQLRDTPSGFLVRFKVARGAEGDEALQLAEDGVLDGLSVGVDFDAATDAVPDPRNRGALLIRRADLREVSLTAMPAFDDARVTSVAASRTLGGPVPDTTPATPAPAPDPTPAPPPAPAPDPPSAQTFSADEVLALLGRHAATTAEPERPTPVDPTRTLNLTRVHESVPYRFDRGGNFTPGQAHVFSADLHEMVRSGDMTGVQTDAGKRVMALMRATFDIDSADINELTPTVNRPDLYVDQRDYRYPLWNSVNKGAPPNGVQPFTFPKFSSASGLVGDHVEGVEPVSGTFVSTNQTVTPTAISGKASITREVWDMGGNPAVSTLIFNQMVRGWNEALEAATATFLNTLTAAVDINLGVAVVDAALAAVWDLAVADLQFVRGYDFSMFAIEKALYKAFVSATADDGRKIYPQLNPTNTNGTAARRFVQLDLGGVIGVPSWALASTAGAPNNSWLFDPATVHGWASSPQRLEFAGTNATGGYAPVAMIDLGIWGYKAFANSDIGGVRQVIYDNA